MSLRLGSIVLVLDKDKAFIHSSGKDGCVAFFYLDSGEC